jgi:hypothetical protein
VDIFQSGERVQAGAADDGEVEAHVIYMDASHLQDTFFRDVKQNTAAVLYPACCADSNACWP